jgi:O-acetyl-ADP-ribose deacetylase (regulator of RNase III)
MIEVRVGELAEADAGAVMRPVSTDFSPVNPAMTRFAAAAGSTVAEQCGRLGELPMGSAVITAGGDLAAPFIVHVAVRSTTEGATPAVVRLGLLNGLRRLEDWAIESVAIAPLGTGAGNLDAEESAESMLPVLYQHLAGSVSLTRVVVVVEDEYQRDAFSGAVARHAATGAETGS